MISRTGPVPGAAGPIGTGIGAGRETVPRAVPASVASRGEVLVTVARTDAPLDEVMRTIEQALKERA